MSALPQQKMCGVAPCVNGIPGMSCMACGSLKAFEVEIYFAGASGNNAFAAAVNVVNRIRENPQAPVFVSVSWRHKGFLQRRIVKVIGNHGEPVYDDDEIPLQ